MAATAKTGVVSFLGLNTNTVYQIPLYNADINGTYCRLDNGGGTPGATGGENHVIFPEGVRLVDCAFVTGIVDTANLRVMVDYSPTRYVVNWANYVNSLPSRIPLNIGFAAGRRISFQQIP